MYRTYRHQTGFTLIELMIVLAIVAIVMTLGVPSFQNLIESNRVETERNQFLTALITARSEAVKRNSRVALCKTSNGSACSTANTVFWHDGWIMFEDEDSDGVIDAGEDIIRESAGTGGLVTIQGNGTVDDLISFNPTGQTRVAGSIFFCPQSESTDHAGRLILNNVGRPRQAEFESGTNCPDGS